MHKPTTLFVGLNGHKESIAVAHAVAEHSEIGTRRATSTSWFVFAYEAGPVATCSTDTCTAWVLDSLVVVT